MKNPFVENLLGDERYEQAFNDSVHYSYKLTNSNVSGGVRVSNDYLLNIPYGCVASAQFHDAKIRTDYYKSAVEGKPFKHLRLSLSSVTEEKIEELRDKVSTKSELESSKENVGKSKSKKSRKRSKKASPDQNDLKKLEDEFEAKKYYASVKEIYESRDKSFRHFGKESIDARMPQVLIKKDDDYVSLSPISSAGYGEFLNLYIEEQGLWYNRADFLLGGSKDNNVGSLVFCLKRPIILRTPEENGDLKDLYRIKYQGVQYNVPTDVFKEYLKWRQSIIGKGYSFERDKRTKEGNINFVNRLISGYLDKLRYCRKNFDRHEGISVDLGSSNSKYHRSILKFVTRQLLESEDLNAISSVIVHKICEWSLDGASINWSSNEIKKFKKIIEGKEIWVANT